MDILQAAGQPEIPRLPAEKDRKHINSRVIPEATKSLESTFCASFD